MLSSNRCFLLKKHFSSLILHIIIDYESSLPPITFYLVLQIALGTVTNVEEGVRWLQYTYLFVRLKCNPLVYGITYSTLEVCMMMK